MAKKQSDQAKPQKIMVQLLRPMVLFMIVLVLFDAIFLFLYNLSQSVKERYKSAYQLGRTAQAEMESYECLGFLIDYWEKNYDKMDLIYDSETLALKEGILSDKNTGVVDLRMISSDEVRHLDAESQKLIAEICYCKLCNVFDNLKQSFDPTPWFLYSFKIKDSHMLFFVTGTLGNEKRVSEGGEVFELGMLYDYAPGVYPVLDEVNETKQPSDQMELSLTKNAESQVVHAFVPVYADGEMVSIIGITLDWKDLIFEALRPSLIIFYASSMLFIVLGFFVYFGLRKYVTIPVGKEEEIISRYEENKNHEEAVKELATIQSGNEIQSLSESFSSMVSELGRYIEEVKSVTSEKERIEAELSMASSIQESQLPSTFPAFPNRKDIDLYASMTPAKEVGGDFYDFYMLDDENIALVIADVSGKGVPAALFMMISRLLIKNHMFNGESPREALFNVNNQLLENNDADLFVTVWLAKINLKTGKGLVSNAGHESPTIRRAGGKYEIIEYRHSPPIATLPNMKFEEHECEIHSGDSIFVYTDGVVEATNSDNKLFGPERMLEALNKEPDADPEKILGNVMDGIREFVGDAEQFDDITMLSVHFQELGET